MSWVRIHDGAMQNLKITALSDSAFRLWIRGLCYCQTALTDGLIPRTALREMGARRRDVEELSMSRLEGRAPLWESHGIGFKVHDYLAWNDPRDKVLDRQRKAKQRRDEYEARKRSEHVNTRKTATLKVDQTRSERVPERVQNASADAIGTASITKPNQVQEEKKEKKKNSSEALTRSEPAFLRFPVIGSAAEPEWALSEAQVAEWVRLFPGLDIHGECRKALAWVQASPGRRKTARGMLRFLVGWLTRAVDRGGPRATVEPSTQIFGKQTTRLLAAVAQLKDTR